VDGVPQGALILIVDFLFALEAGEQLDRMPHSLEKVLSMRINGALSVVLAVGVMGLGGSSCWRQLASATPFEFTEPQPPSPSVPFPPGQMPTAATWQHFLDSVRQTALTYTNTLPDFICTQYVERLAKSGSLGDWRTVDEIVAEVSNHENGEHYRILTINNKPPPPETDISVAGFSSEGDFGNALYLVFAPESNASFRMEGSTRLHRRKTVQAQFYVSKNNSRYYTGFENQKVATAYRGHCWIDLASHRIVRLESQAVDIPPSIPVRVSFHSTDYDLIEISGNQYWLPVRASVRMQLIIDSQHKPADSHKSLSGTLDGSSYRELEVRNVIEYKDYRKFGAEVRLAPE
jgi:hypothetical protein